MAKSEWGTKRICMSCGDPFYDLKKKNVACPKCGASFNPKPPAKPKRLPQSTAKPADQEADRKAMAPAPAKDKAVLETGDGIGKDKLDPALKVDDLAGDDAIVDGGDSKDDEKNDALIEDTSDLSHDDDDVSEVKEHIDDGVEDKN